MCSPMSKNAAVMTNLVTLGWTLTLAVAVALAEALIWATSIWGICLALSSGAVLLEDGETVLPREKASVPP